MQELLRESMELPWTALGAASMALAVALGAFGAHGLKKRVAPERVAIWETAVRYHMIHALGLIALDVVDLVEPEGWAQDPWINLCGWLFVLGTVLFSGSLYVLTVRSGPRWLGPLTPLGGLLWIAGWIGVAVVAAQAG